MITLENGQVIETTQKSLAAYVKLQQTKLEFNNQRLLGLQTQATRILADNEKIVTELNSLISEPII